MNRLILSSIVIVAFAFSAAGPASAQAPRKSPHDIISNVFEGKRDNRVTVIYGRPYSKNPADGKPRAIWGSLVPYGQVWRLGADEATLLITQKDIEIGGTTVPAGAYTLAMQPEENGTSQLIINKQLGQWGVPYTGKATELARVDLKKEASDKDIDQFTMAIESNPSGGGILKMTWEKSQFSVPFTFKK